MSKAGGDGRFPPAVGLSCSLNLSFACCVFCDCFVVRFLPACFGGGIGLTPSLSVAGSSKVNCMFARRFTTPRGRRVVLVVVPVALGFVGEGFSRRWLRVRGFEVVRVVLVANVAWRDMDTEFGNVCSPLRWTLSETYEPAKWSRCECREASLHVNRPSPIERGPWPL